MLPTDLATMLKSLPNVRAHVPWCVLEAASRAAAPVAAVGARTVPAACVAGFVAAASDSLTVAAAADP